MAVRKYRMWDGKKMHQNRDIKHYELGVMQGTCYPTLESSTLFDSNKEEIYQGDIFDDKSVCTVIDGRHMKMWLHEKDANGHNPYEDILPNEETIIGNVFENPDLLKELS